MSTIYEELGVRSAINAMGHVTLLGGSILSPAAQAAMEQANETFVSMDELLDRAGETVAALVGAEAATITSGAYAALVTGMAGIMTGDDPAKIAQLPDTTGMRNEFLILRAMRYHYDRSMTTAGGKMVEVGDESGATLAQIRAAIGPCTAGLLYFARMEGTPGIPTIAELVELAQESGIKLILDAAGEIYPLERMRSLPSCGADLICFGAKYLGSANSSGILCGKAEAVHAARLNGFVSYETQKNRAIGRGYKIDRQEIVGTIVALREWLDADHEERLQTQSMRIEAIQTALADLPHVRAENDWEEVGGPWMHLRITVDPAAGRSHAEICELLKSGDPAVWVRLEDDALRVAVHTLRAGEEQIVARQLRNVLGT